MVSIPSSNTFGSIMTKPHLSKNRTVIKKNDKLDYFCGWVQWRSLLAWKPSGFWEHQDSENPKENIPSFYNSSVTIVNGH